MTIVHNFSTLSPDHILNALDSLGLHTDGRLLALNSYENRVYLAGLETGQVGKEGGAPVVTKFYRLDRWTDAAILEEYSFLQELIEHEIPVVLPSAFDRKTLLEFEGFRYAVFPKHGGRAPELEDRKTADAHKLARLIYTMLTKGVAC